MPPARLVLTLPGLLATAEGRAPHARALARLIATAGAPRHEPDGIGAALAPLYGIDRQRDWPLAPIRLAELGVDPESAYWLVADPVTLVAGRTDVRLDGAVADLAAGDAAALIATLNAHFSADGLAFIAATPAAWFVRAPGVPDLVTSPLDAVLGRTLREALPRGADAGRWRRWQNEIQMLLHEHPVNVARAERGQASANSVWFSQGGTRLPARAPAIATFANDGIARALAAHAGRPASVRPAALTRAMSAATTVIALDRCDEIANLERDWAMPAWQALARGAVSSVTLIADGDGHAAVWTAARPSALQRIALRLRPPALAALMAAASA